MKLTGRRVILRPLRKSDAQDLQKSANSNAVTRYTQVPYPYRLKDAHDFIKKCGQNLRKKSDYEFGIELKKTGKIIGMTSLMKIDKQSKNAELGYWLGKKYWKQGIATEAVGLILKFGFNKLKLERIYARVFHPNRISQTFLRKNRFKYEGRLRKHVKNKGKWFDALYFGILKNEYKKSVK